MANIKRIEGKNGISFKITVTSGRDQNGKQIRHYMTWAPERPMTERQIQKAVEQAAFEFEQSIQQGFQLDRRQTFSAYAEYVIDLKQQAGCKFRTIERYRELLERINPAIGHLRLIDIRPQHLNAFYKNLGERGIAKSTDRAKSKVDLLAVLKEAGFSKWRVAQITGMAPSTVRVACDGKAVSIATAETLASVVNKDVSDLFLIECGDGQLSNKTILEHHRLIHTILAQAEKEMLVPYNAADKTSPPKAARSEVNYFQQDDLERILIALEDEPLRWRVITHLLLITGCRRGEVMGLRWSRVDFKNSQIKIDTNLLYSPKRGVYEDTTKTDSSVRFIKLPAETMQLLKEYRRWYEELRALNGDRWNETDFCFVKDDGTVSNPDGITAWLRKFSARRGLPHINPHAFRHTMASILIKDGRDAVSVSKRLGHAKVSTTMDIYAHIIKEADEQASECLADAILRSDNGNSSAKRGVT